MQAGVFVHGGPSHRGMAEWIVDDGSCAQNYTNSADIFTLLRNSVSNIRKACERETVQYAPSMQMGEVFDAFPSQSGKSSQTAQGASRCAVKMYKFRA